MSTEYTLAELFAAFSNLAETNTKLLRQYDESAARIAVALYTFSLYAGWRTEIVICYEIRCVVRCGI